MLRLRATPVLKNLCAARCLQLPALWAQWGGLERSQGDDVSTKPISVLLAGCSHQYTTLLRSHVGRVNAVAVDPNRLA